MDQAPDVLRHAAGSPTDNGRSLSIATQASASGEASGLGEYPMRPSWQQDILPSADGDTGPQLRTYHWAVFGAGNLIFVAVVVAELSQLFNVRRVDYVGRCEDEAQGPREGTTSSQIPVSEYVGGAIIFLISGLVSHVYFSTVLSLVYLSPLSIQSLYKIPTERSMSKALIFNAYCLAPLSWMWIYMVGFVGGFASGRLSSCPWQGGLWLGVSLLISAMFSFIFVGIPLYLTSLVGFGRTCAPNGSTSHDIMDRISLAVLSKGAFIHCFWQLHGVLWVYRVGGFGLDVSVFLAVCSVIGVVLTAIGSPAPYMPHTPRAGDTPTPFANSVQLTSREHEMSA